MQIYRTPKMNDLHEQIKRQAKEILPKIQAYRTHLHMNPELSFQEFETANFIEAKLTELGVQHERISETGIVALIEGGKPGKVIGLRADIDALPITEVDDGRKHRSINEGIMHACGHDAHSSSLLGVAEILNTHKDDLKGTYKLIFQPGEEQQPGGASILIKNGILENPKVDLMIGQHVMPLIKTGNVGFRNGLYMASTDEIRIEIHGKGGHGAMPHFCVDPISISAQIIVALQQVISRIGNPAIPSVLTIGHIEGKGATNVIPPIVKMQGTFRTFDEDWRHRAHKKIKDIATGIASSFDAEAKVDITIGYPFLKNDEDLTNACRKAAIEYLGDSHVEELGIWMAAEDFSYYSQAVPSVFYRFGVRNEKMGITENVHHPSFDIDPESLETSVGMMAWLAVAMNEN